MANFVPFQKRIGVIFLIVTSLCCPLQVSCWLFKLARTESTTDGLGIRASSEDTTQYSTTGIPTTNFVGRNVDQDFVTSALSDIPSASKGAPVRNSDTSTQPTTQPSSTKYKNFSYKLHEKSTRRRKQIAEILRRYETNENETENIENNTASSMKPSDLNSRLNNSFSDKVTENLTNKSFAEESTKIMNRFVVNDNAENRRETSSSTATTTMAVSTTTRKLEPAYIPQHPKTERRVNNDPQDAPIECLQPIDRWNAQKRPCAEGKIKWYYDPNTGVCRFYNYLGCGKSANRFGTRRECEAFCIEKIEDPCDISVSTCPAYAPNCFTESHSKCEEKVKEENPEEDLYNLKELYRKHCPPKVARCKDELFKYVTLRLSPNYENTFTPELCAQPPDKGSCPGAVGRGALRFYYDPLYRSCLSFYFSGCSGKDNRFDSFQKCVDYCGI